MSLLQVEQLKKYYEVPGGLLHAVDGVSFSLEAGETLGVVGESGCGKTTLGRAVIHLTKPDGGRILWRGEDITRPDRKKLREVRERMQIIFQDPYASLNPRMTVAETVAEPLVICGRYSRQEIAAQTEKLLDRVGLPGKYGAYYPHELDGGRRQRAGIARALALAPEFIVCDEPVSALDVSVQAQILNLLKDLQEELGLTYLFITHDLAVVRYLSRRILVMYLGEAVEICGTEELFAQPLHPYTEALLSAVLPADIHVRPERIRLKGELMPPVNPGPGCRFAARCPYVKEKCFAESPAAQELLPGHLVRCHYGKEIRSL